MIAQGNKRAVETILVSTGNQALANTAEAGNFINDQSNGAVRLGDGQLGLIDATGMGSNDFYSFITAGDVVSDSPVIRIVQGTADSANPANAQAAATYPLSAEPFIGSGDMAGRNIISATKQPAQTPRHSMWVIGLEAGNVAEIQVQDLTEYTVGIAYRGLVIDEYFSPNGSITFNPSFVTPDYTSLSTPQPRDHMIQNLSWNTNRNSYAITANRAKFRGNEPIVGLALDSTGAAGTDASTLTAGTFLPIVNAYFSIGGTAQVRGITLTQAIVDSIQEGLALAGLPTDTGILTIDLTTAGTATGGVADCFALLALDRKLVYDDKIPQVKNRLEVGLKAGFDFYRTYHREVSSAYEGQGQPRDLDIFWKNTYGQRKYNLQHEQIPVISYPSPVDTATTYVQYSILHGRIDQTDTTNLSSSPQKTIVWVPTADTTTVTQLDAALTPYLASANVGLVTIGVAGSLLVGGSTQDV